MVEFQTNVAGKPKMELLLLLANLTVCFRKEIGFVDKCKDFCSTSVEQVPFGRNYFGGIILFNDVVLTEEWKKSGFA